MKRVPMILATLVAVFALTACNLTDPNLSKSASSISQQLQAQLQGFVPVEGSTVLLKNGGKAIYTGGRFQIQLPPIVLGVDVPAPVGGPAVPQPLPTPAPLSADPSQFK